MYLDLMAWYRLSSEMTAGTNKYYTLTEYENMIPYERDLYYDLILQRNQQSAGSVQIDPDEVVSDFEEFNG